ncbi:50S ribosomal protein L9 [Lacihabitans sp. CS3-21]|jgi:large subunit ribosomal protein L9|uniref:50S ribosomal protein L9 n=1 Tax=Lacihabitans sp. CS3-21 TaxID=2487332 RepID=UPI000BCDC4E8|nr:50S ribosomal protein L9 [Lacihabitans sp. CS3-21]MCP9748435.1 50S ribosomal protein L9 [Lacihabitans sp. CS3-21]MDP1816501.1 50S ribosomal protein L9 [Leadbetterella sp.]OYU64744.1 MAG: 50S ribosomal protein L9 [Cytophagaceae bacterium BCCC1]OYU65000.1 MAG: 50S ribosomal protein L9 [Cytophagaceae bacterium BCCC1]
MEIILKTDIAGLGYKNDTLDVKPGYGRNYLIPQGYALLATPSNKKILAENLKQAAHKAEKLKSDAEAIAEQIGDSVFVITMKTGESGRIFGRVTSIQISDALALKGINIDRKKITVEDIKFVGTYKAVVDLHKEVKKEVSVSVVAEVVEA